MGVWIWARSRGESPLASLARAYLSIGPALKLEDARGGTRTHTPLRTIDFKSTASSNSATRAGIGNSIPVYGGDL